MTKIQKRLSMIALLLANFIGGLDTTMLNTALPQIIKDLNGINQLGLLTSMLLFFIAMTTVLWGKLGEVIGNKKAFQLSILIFTIASILGGFSVNIWMMVFARGLMGIWYRRNDFYSFCNILLSFFLTRKKEPLP